MPGFPRGRYGWYGSVAARAYIARTNPNGNSSLRGASPIMHTLVLHSRTHTPPRLVLTSIQSLHPPSLPYIYIYISIYHIYIYLYTLPATALPSRYIASWSAPPRSSSSTAEETSRHLPRQSYLVIPSRTDADAPLTRPPSPPPPAIFITRSA